MNSTNIIIASSNAYLYNEASDTYEHYFSKIEYNWIFVLNKKLYIKTNNKFECL